MTRERDPAAPYYQVLDTRSGLPIGLYEFKEGDAASKERAYAKAMERQRIYPDHSKMVRVLANGTRDEIPRNCGP